MKQTKQQQQQHFAHPLTLRPLQKIKIKNK